MTNPRMTPGPKEDFETACRGQELARCCCNVRDPRISCMAGGVAAFLPKLLLRFTHRVNDSDLIESFELAAWLVI